MNRRGKNWLKLGKGEKKEKSKEGKQVNGVD